MPGHGLTRCGGLTTCAAQASMSRGTPCCAAAAPSSRSRAWTPRWPGASPPGNRWSCGWGTCLPGKRGLCLKLLCGSGRNGETYQLPTSLLPRRGAPQDSRSKYPSVGHYNPERADKLQHPAAPSVSIAFKHPPPESYEKRPAPGDWASPGVEGSCRGAPPTCEGTHGAGRAPPPPPVHARTPLRADSPRRVRART